MIIESRDVGKYAGWYLSYSGDSQGHALGDCVTEYCKQSGELLNTIIGEIELAEFGEYPDSMILESIKTLIENFSKVESERKGFVWYMDWRDYDS